jgi:hypothetical protein
MNPCKISIIQTQNVTDRTIFEMREMKMKCVSGKKENDQVVFDWTPMANVEWTPLGGREGLIWTLHTEYVVCMHLLWAYIRSIYSMCISSV